MAPCVESLASVDKRVAELNRTLAQTVQPVIRVDWVMCKLVCRALRLPSEIRLYLLAIASEKETDRDVANLRRIFLQEECHVADKEVLTEIRDVVFRTKAMLEQAYTLGVPSYILTHMENCSHLWTDLLEDLEVATDPECSALFDDLAAELVKRQ